MLKNEIKVLDHGIVKLIDVYGSDERIADAARTSYQKGTKTVSDNETLIRYLMRAFHTSPLEFAEVTFYLNLPLFVSTQLNRHRTLNLCYESLRYSEARDENFIPLDTEVTYQDPDNKQGGTSNQVLIKDVPNARDITAAADEEDFTFSTYFKQITDLSKDYYQKLIGAGVRRELARTVLPVNQYTQCYLKVDLNNLFKLLQLRLDSHAQKEIRVYAEAMFELVKPHFPIACRAFEDYHLNTIKLTALEIKAFKNLLGTEEILNCINKIEITAKDTFTNKREKVEFISKITKLLN